MAGCVDSEDTTEMISSLHSSGRLVVYAAPREGIRRGLARAGAAADAIAKGEATPENMVSLIEAEALVKASAAAARTTDEFTGAMINARA
jgi:hypothetical protein